MQTSDDNRTAPPCNRTAVVQTIIVGIICFCIPAMWNSITSMAGGIKNKNIATAATGVLYGCLFLTSLVAPVIVNIMGTRMSLFIGGTGYLLYTLSLLVCGALGWLPENLVILAGALNGISAALFWTAQGTLIMSYPTPETKARYFSLFWVIFNFGAVVGGFVSFGVNYNTDEAVAKPSMFIVYALMMAVGCGLCWMLTPLDKVVRPDGNLVEVSTARPEVGPEIRGMIRLLSDWRVLALLPAFIYSNWFYAYQFTCYNSTLFTARTQGLNNVFYWSAEMLAASAVGQFLDLQQLSKGMRAWTLLLVASLAIGASWVWGFLANAQYGLNDFSGTLIDFKQNEWWGPLILYFLWGITDASFQTWCYWCMGQLEDSPETLSRFSGVYKGFQSVGAAVSWLLTTSTLTASMQAVIVVVIFVLSLPGAMIICRAVGKKGISVADDVDKPLQTDAA